MSTPRNHHYVSQVISKKFFANGEAFLYKKSTNQLRKVTSTKNLFSQRDLNTARCEGGNIDHGSAEETLNKHFETDFNTHYNRIAATVSEDHEIGKPIPNSKEITEALKYLNGMALIGEARTPYKMAQKYATDELKAAIYGSYHALSDVNNKIPLDFKELSDGILKLMGDVTYSIMIAPDGHYFILPDCSSTTKRFKEADTIGADGEVYINPSMVIGSALMPISSKMLIACLSSKHVRGNGNGIYTLKPDLMLSYNEVLFDEAYEGVICENKEYFEEFIIKRRAQHDR
jgi:hypothetical protein